MHYTKDMPLHVPRRRVLHSNPTCQESKRTFGFLCLEGAVGAIWTNPASQGSKMVRVFDFWRQNGAKIDPKGNGAKIAFFRILAYFRKFDSTSNQNWRHLIGAIFDFFIRNEKYGHSAFTGKKLIS